MHTHTDAHKYKDQECFEFGQPTHLKLLTDYDGLTSPIFIF